MTGAEIIYAVVAVTATLAGFGLGWVAGAAYVRRLRRHLAAARADVAELAEQLAETEAALGRATGGMTDILDAVLPPHAGRHRAQETAQEPDQAPGVSSCGRR